MRERCLVVSPPFFPPMRPIFPKKSSPYRFLVVWPPLRPASALLIFLVSGIRPPPLPNRLPWLPVGKPLELVQHLDAYAARHVRALPSPAPGPRRPAERGPLRGGGPRPRPALRGERARALPGGRDGARRPAPPRLARPRPDHRRHPRPGPGRRPVPQLGRRGVAAGGALRHRRGPQGRLSAGDPHPPVPHLP